MTADPLIIEPLTRTLSVRGNKVAVDGIEPGAAIHLVLRFPLLIKAIQSGSLEPASLAAMSDELASAIIAAGCDRLDEGNAAKLTIGEKLELLSAVVATTIPDGPEQLIEALAALLQTIGGTKAGNRRK